MNSHTSSDSETSLETRLNARPVTLKMVALHAGVHANSASLVLNGAKSNTRVSEETRQRILKAAEELGYRPNGMAQGMAKGRFNSVALVTSSDSSHSHLPRAILIGLQEVFEPSDMHLSLMRVPDEALTHQSYLPKALRQWMADGVLIDYTGEQSADLKEATQRLGIPAVWIQVDHEFDAVYPDDEAGGYLATRHLLELGHRSILYAGPPASSHCHFSFRARQAGYERALRESRLAPQVVESTFDNDATPAESTLHALFAQSAARPTAVVAYSVTDAALSWRAASSLGLSVPTDLSLVALGETDYETTGWLHVLERISGIRMTRFSFNNYELGESAGRLMMQKLQDPSLKMPSVVVPFRLEQGTSCAPPP